MIVIVILLLLAAIAIGAWQYEASHAASLAAQIRIEEIQAASRLDVIHALLPIVVVLALAAVVITWLWTHRRPPVVHDNRTVVFLPPGGESRRQFYKSLPQGDALLQLKKRGESCEILSKR